MGEDSSIIRQKSYQFALHIIGLYLKLKSQQEYDLSRQLLRAGTSIGANVAYSSDAGHLFQRKPDTHSSDRGHLIGA